MTSFSRQVERIAHGCLWTPLVRGRTLSSYSPSFCYVTYTGLILLFGLKWALHSSWKLWLRCFKAMGQKLRASGSNWFLSCPAGGIPLQQLSTKTRPTVPVTLLLQLYPFGLRKKGQSIAWALSRRFSGSEHWPHTPQTKEHEGGLRVDAKAASTPGPSWLWRKSRKWTCHHLFFYSSSRKSLYHQPLQPQIMASWCPQTSLATQSTASRLLELHLPPLIVNTTHCWVCWCIPII